jgi:hypothetical protein
MNALQNAALQGDTARLKLLLAEGADITERGPSGCGVVFYATVAGNFATLSWLLSEGGASINEVGNDARHTTVWDCLHIQLECRRC